MIADEREKAKQAGMALKLALITHSPEQFLHLLEEPSFVVRNTPKRATVEPVKEATEADLEDTTGRWEFSDDISPEEAMAVLAGLNGAGTLTASEMEGHWQ